MWWTVLLLGPLGPQSLLGQGALNSRYRLDTFTTAHGLPSNATTDIAATRDGYLWIIAGGLLARFDGLEFKAYGSGRQPRFPRRIHSLHAGKGDTLWIVDDIGMVLALFRNQVTTPLPQSGTDAVNDVAQDEQGNLFALRISHWAHLQRTSSWRALGATTGASSGLSSWRDRNGVLWILDQDGFAKPYIDGAVTTAQHQSAPVLVASPSRREVYAVRRRRGFREVVANDGSVVATYPDKPGSTPRIIDRRGRLWLSTPAGTEVYARDNVIPISRLDYPLRRFVEDDNGCMWSVGSGLKRACPVPFMSISASTALSLAPTIAAIARGRAHTVLTTDQSGSLWSATPEGGRLMKSSGPGGLAPVIAPLTDSSGTIWWSEVSGTYGHRRDGTTVVAPVGHAQPLALEPGNRNVVWFTDNQHVHRVDVSVARVPRILTSVAHGATNATLASIQRNGVGWIVLQERDMSQRLLRIEHGKASVIQFDEQLHGGLVRSIRADDDGTVWLGTYGAGLLRLRDGRFRAVQERDGLAEDVVTGVVEDAGGNFWMGGNRSIHRVRKAQVEAFLDGRASRVYGTAYGHADGIKDPETSGVPPMSDAAGRIWFPTLDGIAIVDPVFATALDSAIPSVRVHALTNDSDTIEVDGLLDDTTLLQLTPSARRIAISFGAIALHKARGIRYEYRTDGMDTEWRSAGASRTVSYNQMPAGLYRFRVRAISADGRVGQEDARLAFTVPARFHETRLFLATVLLGTAMLIWLAYRARVGALRRRAAEFSRQLAERTSDLSVALQTVAKQADDLRELGEAKSRFFANVSHEFRTPLSLILGPAEALAKNNAGTLTPFAARNLEMMIANAHRLLQLVDQLLDATRLEAGKLALVLEHRDLIPLVRRVTDSFSSLAAQRGISFRLSCPLGGLLLDFDADQMEKIIGNLVGNALKFTPQGGSVEVRVRVSADDEAFALIEVEDSGPGIAPEHQHRIFERFYQVDDSPRRAHGGVGIGLALTKEIVALHHGTIRVDSALGEGATFIVQLPCGPSPWNSSERAIALHAGPAAPDADRGGLHPTARPPGRDATEFADMPMVLIVEDNAELLEFLEGHMRQRYRVLSAPNGAAGLALARLHVPDLIVSDVMMPVMDGQALCEAVKSDPEIGFIPVILLTARASRDSRLSGLTSGADDYLTKPADLDELLTRSDNLIASRRRVRERFIVMNTPLPVTAMTFREAPRDASTEGFLRRVDAVLSQHLSDPDFQVDQMGATLSMGRSTLYRKLRKEFGKSPMDVLFDYRLAQAAQWLAETRITVSEVAYGVGFRSVPHFCTKFRERYGETPSAYRTTHVTPATGPPT